HTPPRRSSLSHRSRSYSFPLSPHPPPPPLSTLSLHDALPIFVLDCSVHHAFALEAVDLLPQLLAEAGVEGGGERQPLGEELWQEDRKSTRLNSSHVAISYAVFCLKKKKTSTPHKTVSTASRAA